MIGVLRGIMVGLWLFGLAACAPAYAPEGGSGPKASAITAWRHWQPLGQPLGQPSGRPAGQADGVLPKASLEGKSAEPAAPGPRAVILALHGFNDYSHAFEDFAAYSRERGIAVHAYDQRSFGANPDRGIWPGTEPLVADLRNAVGELRAIYGDRPLFVLGESMGGAVTVVAAAGEERLDVDGLILTAPAVWGGRHMNPFYRLTLWLASTLAPGWTLSPSGLEIYPSDNIEMLRAYSADPMVIKVTRTDAIAGLVSLMDEALAAAPGIDQQILLLIGEKDEIVPLDAIDDFEGSLKSARATAIRYPEGYHMLLRDLQRERVFADIERWMDGVASGRETPPSRQASTGGDAAEAPDPGG